MIIREHITRDSCNKSQRLYHRYRYSNGVMKLTTGGYNLLYVNLESIYSQLELPVETHSYFIMMTATVSYRIFLIDLRFDEPVFAFAGRLLAKWDYKHFTGINKITIEFAPHNYDYKIHGSFSQCYFRYLQSNPNGVPWNCDCNFYYYA